MCTLEYNHIGDRHSTPLRGTIRSSTGEVYVVIHLLFVSSANLSSYFIEFRFIFVPFQPVHTYLFSHLIIF